MAGILDFFMPQDFMNPNNNRRQPAVQMPNIMQQLAAAEPAPPAPAAAPGRAPESIPAVAARAGEGPQQAPPRVNPFTQSGPIINNAGVLSDAGGVTGFEPMRGTANTPGARGLSALGYAQNLDGSLRNIGSMGQYEPQVNLMTELYRMAQQAAPGINASDTATRNQQQMMRDQFMGQQMGSLMNNFAPGIMANSLGQQRLGLDTDIARGVGGVPGSIQNDAIRAHAALLGVQNSPRAEDVAADRSAEMQIQNLMSARGMSEAAAVDEMRRTGQRLPRRLGGIGGEQHQGLSPIPNWMAQATGAPQAPQTPGAPIQPPVQNNAAPVNLIPPGDIVANAARTAAGAVPAARDAQGNMIRPAYNDESRNNYLNSISMFLEGMNDEQLRANLPAIQARLTSQEFGGPRAYQDFLNQNSTPAVWSQDVRNRIRQRRRLGDMTGLNFEPLTPLSPNFSQARFIDQVGAWPMFVPNALLSQLSR